MYILIGGVRVVILWPVLSTLVSWRAVLSSPNTVSFDLDALMGDNSSHVSSVFRRLPAIRCHKRLLFIIFFVLTGLSLVSHLTSTHSFLWIILLYYY